MDEKDLEILRELQKDGKAKIKKIAKKLGIPMSTVHHRILRMEKGGIIKKYMAVPDYRKIGLPVCFYVLVNVSYGEATSQEAVARKIRKIPNVLEVNIVSGELDIIVKARAADIEDLGKSVLDKMRNIRGVLKTVTSVVMREMD